MLPMLFLLGYARKTCRGIRARGFRRLVTDVNWVPALSFVAAAIEDLNLNCDGFVALGRRVFEEAYPLQPRLRRRSPSRR